MRVLTLLVDTFWIINADFTIEKNDERRVSDFRGAPNNGPNCRGGKFQFLLRFAHDVFQDPSSSTVVVRIQILHDRSFFGRD